MAKPARQSTRGKTGEQQRLIVGLLNASTPEEWRTPVFPNRPVHSRCAEGPDNLTFHRLIIDLSLARRNYTDEIKTHQL